MSCLQNNNLAHRLCVMALATALTFLMTVIPKIPIPLGYAHLGDAVVFLLPFFLKRKDAMLAAAVGSALADFLGGFPIWVLPTLFIKAGMAYATSLFVQKSPQFALIGCILASLILTAGYTVFGALIYGSLETGLLQIPGLLAEGAVNTAAAFILLIVLRNMHMIK